MAEEEITLEEMTAPDGEHPLSPEIKELVKHFVPIVIAGDMQQAYRWAKAYGLSTDMFYYADSPRKLYGLSPNRHMIVLVGTYRQQRSWEMCEIAQSAGQYGIRLVHGGLF